MDVLNVLTCHIKGLETFFKFCSKQEKKNLAFLKPNIFRMTDWFFLKQKIKIRAFWNFQKTEPKNFCL